MAIMSTEPSAIEKVGIKPRIWRVQGVWWCSMDGIRGIGGTPKGAYHAWRQGLQRREKAAQKQTKKERPWWRIGG